MTATELSYDIPLNPNTAQPKPAACLEPTVASFTIETAVRDNGFTDTWAQVMRSCGHGPYYTSGTPVVGARAMTCLGPQVETVRSGRADPTLPPMKKGKRWTVVKPERGVSLRVS